MTFDSKRLPHSLIVLPQSASTFRTLDVCIKNQILTEAMVLYTLKNEAALRPRIYSVDNNSWGRNVSVRPNVFSREIFRPTKNEGKYVSDQKKRGTSRTGTRNTSTPAMTSKSQQRLHLLV